MVHITYHNSRRHLSRLIARLSLSLGVLALALAAASCATPHLAEPSRYNVELVSGASVLCQRIGYDSVTDRLTVITVAGERREFKYRDVERITDISTPIDPTTVVDSVGECPFCYECPGRPRCTEGFFTEARILGKYRGSGSYVRQTANGPQEMRSETFTLAENGTTLALEAQGAWGIRSGPLQLGLFAGVMPADGSWFLPVGLHGRYDFSCACATPNIFLNIGLPLDFRTGTPVFVGDFKRQRKYVSAGVGYTMAIGPSLDLAFDLGYQYLTVPLSQIDCCSGVPAEDRFPARNVQSVFIGAGLSW